MIKRIYKIEHNFDILICFINLNNIFEFESITGLHNFIEA